jgi:hypothetical protein
MPLLGRTLMLLWRIGMALAVLLAACATPSSLPRCKRAEHFEDGMTQRVEYRKALQATFPDADVERGVCVPGSLDRCFVFDRLDYLEGRCYAVEKAYR